MEDTDYHKIEKLITYFTKEVYNVIKSNDYNICINIEPPEIAIEPTGYVSLETIQSWDTSKKENGFFVKECINGQGYYYEGNLTTTVK